MTNIRRPDAIENQWDVLCRDYADVYEKWVSFAKTPTAEDFIETRFGVAGKTLLDIGSGTGSSAFSLARRAGFVFGIEPDDAMRDLALSRAETLGTRNVAFLKGTTERIPLLDESVDMAVAITPTGLDNAASTCRFAAEAERVVRTGGLMIAVNVPPGWYGGELCPVIFGKSREELSRPSIRDILLERLGYDHVDFDSEQDYGSVDNVVRTYGFFFGKNVINHVREHQQTVICWRARVHYKQVRR